MNGGRTSIEMIAREFERIEWRIRNAQSKAVRAGFHPTEIWLGEVEMALFKKHTEMQFLDRRQAHEQMSNDGILKYAGMEVRESTLRGVRVGVSWESDK